MKALSESNLQANLELFEKFKPKNFDIVYGCMPNKFGFYKRPTKAKLLEAVVIEN